MSRSGEGRHDLVIEGGTFVTFDFLIEGGLHPDRFCVHTGSMGIQGEVVSTFPLTMLVG